MGWTDILKRKASELGLTQKAAELQVDPRLRWFGKLPTYADYYSSPVDEEWTQEFHDWILQGYEVYHRRRENDPPASPPTGGGAGRRSLPSGECMIRLPKSGMTVLASIEDYGGDMRGRQFPLCFYVGIPSAQWPGPTSEQMAPTARVVRDLMALRQEVIRFCNSPGHFDSIFAGRELDLSGVDADCRDDTWLTEARGIAIADWFARVKDGMKEKDPDCWFRLARQWGRCIAENESDSFEPTLCFPITRSLSLDAQLAGWMRWLEHLMDLRRRSLSLMVGSGSSGTDGRLTVIARQIVPEDFLLMTPLSGTLSYLDDVSEVADGDRQDDTEATPGEAGATLDDAGETPTAAPSATGRPDASEPPPSPATDMAGHWADFVDTAP